MDPTEFARKLELHGAHFDRLAEHAGRALPAGDDAAGFWGPLYAALAARCRDLASEARITDAGSFDQLEDRREALARPAPARPLQGRRAGHPAFRYVAHCPVRFPDPAPVPVPAVGSDVFDPDTGAGWEPRRI